jgi:uncharacterized repeat protein (TIGR03803 family)
MTDSRFSELSVFLILAMLASVANAQTLSVLYNFGSASGDPLNPAYIGAVAQGQDGSLYTTAPHGGIDDGVCCGAVFKITPAGDLSTLYNFSGGADGSEPQSGLTLGTDGNFYGTTLFGGAGNVGTVFKITPQGTLTTLYTFTGGTDGGYPAAPPVEGTDGSFYGTAVEGGAANCDDGDGCGTIYKISPTTGFSIIYQFDFTHGNSPTGLILGTDGNFYGTTSAGGANDLGVIFKITPTGKLTVLHNVADGQTCFTALVEGSDGNFYGVSNTGPGSHGHGAVFKMTPSGKFTILHSMNPTTDGEQPTGLSQATDGNFYGVNAYGGPANSNCMDTSCGTLFEITPAGAFSVLYYFNYTTGMAPEVAPFQHTSGALYADTEFGGTGDLGPCSPVTCGVFYSWTNASLPPFVSLLPYSGKVGKTIEFLGQGFIQGQTTVSFNGAPAAPTVVSSTYLTAKVPNDATTGPVTVTTSGVELASNKIFRVAPQLRSFNPTSGPVGTSVTITGVSLTQTQKVTFGGIAATQFTVNSDKQVTATVPEGAVTGHIAITTAGGTAVSSAAFTVTQ